MVGRLLILIAGVASGILMILVLEQSRITPAETMATVSTPLPTSELPEPNAATPPAINTVADVPQGERTSVAPPPISASVPLKIPSVYREVMGPVPRSLTFAELHARFEQEPRDDTWAYAMETGINSHIANYGAGEGMVIEYVECRSNYCEVGGYAMQGFKADFRSAMREMRQTDWWLVGGRSQIRSKSKGGRFLAIINRYNDRHRGQ